MPTSTTTLPDPSTTDDPTTAGVVSVDRPLVERLIAKRSFCTVATVSPTGRPHAAGVLYAAVGSTLYVSTLRSSRKARNVAADPQVAVFIAVRRLPVGPPSSLHFQATAETVDLDDPTILELAHAGQLKAITSHGELDLPGGCFLRIQPVGRVFTYGIGLSLRRLLREPFNAGGHLDL